MSCQAIVLTAKTHLEEYISNSKGFWLHYGETDLFHCRTVALVLPISTTSRQTNWLPHCQALNDHYCPSTWWFAKHQTISCPTLLILCRQCRLSSSFLPAWGYASAGLCDSIVSVRLPVCPSRAGIVSKRRKLSVMISSMSGSPTILVFWCQISSRHSKGFPPSELSNKGGVGKKAVFYV